MPISRVLPLFFSSLILLQACHKPHEEPDISLPTSCGTRLRMISSLDKESYTSHFRTFSYDGSGRVETFIDSIRFRSDNGGYIGTSSYLERVEYDQGDRITQITEREGSIDSIFQLWFYNAENLVVKNIRISKLEKDTFIHTYNYDAQKRLVIDSVFDNKNKSLVNYTTFRYDTNDNAIEWDHYTNSSGTLLNDFKTEATYDDHPNPFQFIGIYAVPYYDNNSGLSRNNVVTLTASNGTTVQYQYQYCSNGWPMSAVIRIITAGQTKEMDFGYQYD